MDQFIEKINYVDLQYEPTDKDIIVLFKLTPKKGVSMKKGAGTVALESSIGTWTSLSTMEDRIARDLKPSVFWYDSKTKLMKVAYPQELFEPGNMPQIYSSIAGNIFGMKAVERLRLCDVTFTKKLIKSFQGPTFGIEGIRKLLDVKKRPLVGTIVKPKLGLHADEHAKVAYESWSGGLDIVKDDENLANMSFNNFEDRITLTLEARDKVQSETGEKKMYMANITSETLEMLRRADFVKSYGGEYIMVDILTSGWAALQTVRKEMKYMAIHAHRAMHGALDRQPDHGIHMNMLAKTARLIGVDQLHVGTFAVGKMAGGKTEEESVELISNSAKVEENLKEQMLEQDFYGIKTVFPVASGGLQPGLFEDLVAAMGTDIVAQCGGGCHGHPDGTRAGAQAIRQAMEAISKGISLKNAAENHIELKKALEKWGLGVKQRKLWE